MPEVARSLPTVSAGGRRYTFRIREGFRFSPPSNERVTAETFKYAIERSMSPKLKRAAIAQVFMGDLAGLQAYRAGRAEHISGVVARRNRLEIELTRAAPDFPARIALPFFCAVPIGTPIDPGGLREIPSAGPYYVSSYTPNEQIVLRRNPNYQGPRPHRLDEIVYTLGIPKHGRSLRSRRARPTTLRTGFRLEALRGSRLAMARAARRPEPGDSATSPGRSWAPPSSL